MTFRWIAFLAVATVLLFAVAFAGIAFAVNHAVTVEQQIQSAQNARARVLRLQLDEETAVRAYVDTQNVIFLEPYQKAKPTFDGAIAALRTAVTHVAPKLVAAVDDQTVTNRHWLDIVAEPLVANPKSSMIALQLEGRGLVDRFRNDDDTIQSALVDAARRSDTFARSIVFAIIATGLVLGSGMLTLMLWLGRRHQRLEDDLRVKDVLYDREREVADALEQALIAHELPSAPGLALHARYRAAQEPERVGGDWYDAFLMPDGRFFIMLGDVTGHGMKAITLMSRVRNAITAAALRERDPGVILTAANRQLLQTFSPEPILATAGCAVLDPTTREIAYATAGHPAPILVLPDAGAQLLTAGDLILGVQNHVYQTHVAHVLGSALLVFYTDGLIEFTRDILSGQTKLLQAAREAAFERAENPALAIKQQVLDNTSPHDDVAILTVTFGPGEPKTLHIDARSAGAESTLVSGFASSLSSVGEKKAKVPLPLWEERPRRDTEAA